MEEKSPELFALIQEGKIDEARALLAELRERAKYAPDTIVISSKGKPARFTHKRKAVELGPDGKWRLKTKKS